MTMSAHTRLARAREFNPLHLLRVGNIQQDDTPDGDMDIQQDATSGSTWAPMQSTDTNPPLNACQSRETPACPSQAASMLRTTDHPASGATAANHMSSHAANRQQEAPSRNGDNHRLTETNISKVKRTHFDPPKLATSKGAARPPRPPKNQAENPPLAPEAPNPVKQPGMKVRGPTVKERLAKALANWLSLPSRAKPVPKVKPRTSQAAGVRPNQKNQQTTMEEAWEKKVAPPHAQDAQRTPAPSVDATSPVPAIPFQPSGQEVLTLNAMGILSHEDTINATLTDTTPAIFALTETHTKKHMHHNSTGKRLRTTLFAGYRVHFSSAPPGEDNIRHHQRSKGGIVLGVSSELAGPGTFERINTPSAIRLSGYILHCTLRRTHPTLQPSLNLIGVYMPEDMAKRRSIYSYIRMITEICKDRGEDLIVLGDFNAVLHPEDRSGPLDAADKLHQQETANLRLQPLGNSSVARDHTYRRAQRPNAPPYTSRIDDILIWNKTGAMLPHMPERVVEPGGNLDHQSLLVALPCPILPGLAPPEKPESPREPGLAYPIKKGDLEDTKRKIGYSVEIHDLWAALRKYREELEAALQGDHSAKNVLEVSETYRDHHDSHAVVDRLGNALAAKGQEAHKVMMDTCTKANPPTVPHFSRTKNRKFRALLSKSKALKHFLTSCTSEDNLFPCIHNLIKSFPDILPADTHPGPLTLEGARELANTHLQKVHQNMTSLKEDRTKRQKEAARSDFQAKLSKQPKKTHRAIFQDPLNDDDPQAAFPEVPPGAAFHDGPPDGAHICTNPKRVLEVITEYFTGLFAPGHVVKTGKYLPKDREAGFTYPWERPDNPDNFKLAPPPGHMDPETSDLLELILDPHTLRD